MASNPRKARTKARAERDLSARDGASLEFGPRQPMVLADGNATLRVLDILETIDARLRRQAQEAAQGGQAAGSGSGDVEQDHDSSLAS